MTKMNPELKAKWVEALRSGKYTQTDAFLRRGDEYCCLGVLCDISGKAQWGSISDYVNIFVPGGGLSDTSGTLLESFTDSIGLPRSVHDELYTMNDEGKTFPEIADYIEANL